MLSAQRNEQLAFAVYPEDKERLRALAEREGEALAVICRRLLRLGLATLEAESYHIDHHKGGIPCREC